MTDNRLELVQKIQSMGKEKFALAFSRMTDEQKQFIFQVVKDTPQLASSLKQVISTRVKEDVRGIPQAAAKLIDIAKAFGGLFDDNQGDSDNEQQQ